MKKVVPYLTYLGIRPILPDELEQYELHHRARIAIKPGITGMWQVSGRSDITDFEEIVRLDTEYISEWNIGLDILSLTPGRYKNIKGMLNPRPFMSKRRGKRFLDCIDKDIGVRPH